MEAHISPDETPGDQTDNTDTGNAITEQIAADPLVEQRRQRLLSLDAFRGLTILGMLLVNNVALDTATPKHLMHAGWNEGVTFADMVFPWFLFILGVAIPYSLASHRKKGLPAGAYATKAVSRAIILVLLGCLIDSTIAKRPVFDLGVLQIIGLAYMIAAILALASTWLRLLIAVLLLLGHWAVIRFTPVPGAGAGAFSESANAIKHINTYLQAYNLQGLVSVAPTAALALIGSAIGQILHSGTVAPVRKSLYVVLIGCVLAWLGWFWNSTLPFSKPLWTGSYILYTAGLAGVALGLFYLMIDVKRWQVWCFPLVVFGMNAITAYVAPILVKIYVMQGWNWYPPHGPSLPLQQAYLKWTTGMAGNYAGGWIYTVSYILFWWLILLAMYRKKIFLKI